MKTLPAFSVCALLAALAGAPACRAQEPAAPAAPRAVEAPKPAPKQAPDKEPGKEGAGQNAGHGAPRAGGQPVGGLPMPMPGVEMDAETKELQKELQKTQIRAQLRQFKAQAELAEMNEETARLAAKLALEKARRDADRAAAQEADDKANFELQQKLAAGARRARELQAQVEALSAENQLAQAKLATETKQADTVLQARAAREKLASVVQSEVAYADEPFKDGVLTITDRRVEFNGPVTAESVKPVVEQIQFFANQSDKPIFLVIGMSPGGSVAAGETVIKAMESSRAPVHVVVQQFAASMAATICTLAPHSYAYPNAIILHHQMSYGGGGRENITQHREALRHADAWYERLAGPVAKKMGISTKDLVKRMYEHNSDGDWQEFADKAQELKWVDHVVKEVRDLGIREKPKAASLAEAGRILRGGLDEKVDDKGKRCVQLPRLEAHDCWFIHNRDGYWRE